MIYGKIGKVFISAMSAFILFSGVLVGAAEQESGFKDLKLDHWGYEAILWAKEIGIVDGYPDGTFKPEQSVGQTEFLAMLVRAYMPKNFIAQSSNSDWRTPYVQYGYKMGWGGSYIVPPSSKLSDSSSPEIAIYRKRVAKLITNASGRNYGFEDSIRFLLDNGLAEGKTDNTVSGFEENALLTRAEAVTFIKNVKSKLDFLYPSPGLEHNYDPSTLTLNPFESFPLDVNQPDEFSSFSHVTFKNPSAGYNLTHESSYAVTGSVKKAVGNDLTIVLELWESGVFVSVKTLMVPIANGELIKEISLPQEGIYRITIYSNQEKIPKDISLTSFYVEYKEKTADQSNAGL